MTGDEHVPQAGLAGLDLGSAGRDPESALIANGVRLIAGVDEAGRGPLAGPVVAAAVIFKHDLKNVPAVADSKLLSPSRREKLFGEISESAAAIGLGIVSPEKIDEMNILRAALEAMRTALSELKISPEAVLVDGNMKVPGDWRQITVVGGDRLCRSISAASIIAKVSRDKIMAELDALYPQYGFIKHKGYGTKEHLESLRRFGPSPVHRKTFGGVKGL